MKYAFLVICLALLAACSPTAEKQSTAEAAVETSNLPELLVKGLDAHGGLDRWQKMKSLQFAFEKDSVTKEVQQVALDNRKVRITRGDVQLGFNGEEVWVKPNREAFGKGDPRFYHNVYFYFYAMPFVLADPGIKYEPVPAREVFGKSYPGLKISFNDGVGDAPDDYYIAYFDADSGELYLLLYTVTYGDEGPNENFSALMYEEWMTVNGVKLPKIMSWYKFENDTLGEKRREKLFDQVEVSEKAYGAELFEETGN